MIGKKLKDIKHKKQQKQKNHDIKNNSILHYYAAIHLLHLFGIKNCNSKKAPNKRGLFFIESFLPLGNQPQKNADFRKKNLNFVAFSI